jgi:hypothetical protein
MRRKARKQVKGRRGSIWDAAPLFCAVIAIVIVFTMLVHGDTSAAERTLPSLAPGEAVPGGSLGIEGSNDPEGGPDTTGTTAKPIYTHPIPDPVRIVIPAIEVDAPIVPVGILEDEYMEVPPFGIAGWYSLGPAPGDHGPALIAGHLDTTRGKDIFNDLKYLEQGDLIIIFNADGDPAVFETDYVEQQLKVDFPKERIFPNTYEPLIRLITCGGKWNSRTRHYMSNVIVYGHLIK